MIVKSVRRPLALLCAFVLTAGCGSSSEVTDNQDLAWIVALQPRLGEALDTIPEEQVAVLIDGDLTFDELESAKLNEIRCASDGWHPLTGEVTYDEATLTFDYQLAGASAEDVNRMAETLRRCHIEHFAYVGAVWQELHRPTIEQQAAASAAMAACLTTAGVDGFPEPGTAPFRQWGDQQSASASGSAADALARCNEAVEREHGLVP